MGTLDTTANSVVKSKDALDRNIRGGSWGSVTYFLRGFSVLGCAPYTIHGYYGFRVARDVPVVRSLIGGSWEIMEDVVSKSNKSSAGPAFWDYNMGVRVACEPEVESRSLRGGSWFLSYPYMNIPIRGGDLVTSDWRHTFSFRVACRAEPRLFVIRSCPWKLYDDYASVSTFTCLVPTFSESSALGFRVCYEDDG